MVAGGSGERRGQQPRRRPAHSAARRDHRRDGGESIELFVDERRPIEDFYDEWTATHEFSHLMLPRISWRRLIGFCSFSPSDGCSEA